MDAILSKLEHTLRSGNTVGRLAPVIDRLLRELDQSPAQPQAWQPLDENFLDVELPGGIASCWLFALRGAARFPAERHPNSWQRSIALRGRALFEIYQDGAWQPRPLDGAGATIEKRSISIPTNMWHRIEIGSEPLVSLSFHTVPAAELIEETCVGNDFSQTHRRLYQS